MDWQDLVVDWRSLQPSHPDAPALPAEFATPPEGWNYGAITDLIHTAAPATVRIQAKALRGAIGIAFVSDDSSELRSAEQVLKPEQGEQRVELRLFPRKSPARLMVRHHGDETGAGAVAILSAAIRHDRPEAAEAHPRVEKAAGGAFDAIAALVRQADGLEALKPRVARGLEELRTGDSFALNQGLVLGAVIRDFAPDVILDLGTGMGGSAMAMGMADGKVPIHTFDLAPQWKSRAGLVLTDFPANVDPVVGDIVEHDYAPLLAGKQRPLIFWDAHGFEIAARVLSHIMPLIADLPHLVFCHDIADNRESPIDDESGSYGGKRMWRGYHNFNDNPEITSQAYIGWMFTSVDQAIAIGDFAHRNRMTVHTIDHDLRQAAEGDRDRIRAALGPDSIGLTYFTMNETRLRHFPAS